MVQKRRGRTGDKGKDAVRGRKGEDAFALALAAGLTVRQAARKAGIGETTAYQRAAEPDVKARVAQLRWQMVSQAVGKLSDLAAGSVDALGKLIKSENENVRLSAVRTVLEHLSKGLNTAEIMHEMDRVKEMLDKKGESKK